MDDVVRQFRALADPTRVQIVVHLAAGDLCVGALAQRLGVTQSAVSQHLRILREAGLVNGEKHGYWVHYSLDRGRTQAVAAQVAAWFAALCGQQKTRCASGAPCAGSSHGPSAKPTGRSRER